MKSQSKSFHRRFLLSCRWADILSAASPILFLGLLLLTLGVQLSQGQTQNSKLIELSVTDDKQQPLAGVTIEARNSQGTVTTAVTDAQGRATISCGNTMQCTLTASLSGYTSANTIITEKENVSAASIALAPALADQQTVVVQGQSQNPVTESSAIQATLEPEEAKYSPIRPTTLIEALPMVPGVIRTTDGRVQISGLDEPHSTLIVNFVDVSDPATGNFGLSVPVDTVDVLNVAQSPYLAQYGNFTAGVISAQTRRGGDKWNYDLNDPLPEFRIRSGHLQGLRSATPRFNLSGPLVNNRLYFLEGTEYLMHKTQVRTLPFPVNETKSNAVNSFTQIDSTLGAQHSLTGTMHFAPHTMRYANLNYFDPREVTPNADYQEDTGTLTDRIGIRGGVLASTFAVTRVATNVAPQGAGLMTLTPIGDSGNYFNTQSREATRFQWLETWNPPSQVWLGKHDLQLGSVLAHAENEGYVRGQNVEIRNSSGALLRTITWTPKGNFHLSDFEPAVYVQDHWMMGSHFAIDAGIRAETQTLTFTNRFAPRTGFTWSPRSNGATVIRGGIGVFYDAVPLDTYAFDNYPEQTITTYDGHGNVIDGPTTYMNITSVAAKSGFPFIHSSAHAGNFAPYSVTWNIEGEQSISNFLSVRLRFLSGHGRNQLTLQPQTTSQWSAFVLGGTGDIQNHQVDFTVRAGENKQRQVFFSYVRQYAHGDLTDATSYLGNFPFPIVRPLIQASTAGEIPNRFLIWGNSTLPWKMRIDPRIEYRNGFTWQPTDEYQNYISLASQMQPRYPRYFSADASLSKDIKVNGKHAVRLTLTGRNLTDHTNPLQVHSNIADPAYGTYFGNYGRHLLVDFDWLF